MNEKTAYDVVFNSMVLAFCFCGLIFSLVCYFLSKHKKNIPWIGQNLHSQELEDMMMKMMIESVEKTRNESIGYKGGGDIDELLKNTKFEQNSFGGYDIMMKQ